MYVLIRHITIKYILLCTSLKVSSTVLRSHDKHQHPHRLYAFMGARLRNLISNHNELQGRVQVPRLRDPYDPPPPLHPFESHTTPTYLPRHLPTTTTPYQINAKYCTPASHIQPSDVEAPTLSPSHHTLCTLYTLLHRAHAVPMPRHTTTRNPIPCAHPPYAQTPMSPSPINALLYAYSHPP